MHSMRHASTKGFTLIEMLIIAPVVILAIGGFITTLVFMTGDALASRANNTMAFEVQEALNQIEQDVRLSGAFLAQNNFAPTTPQGVNNTATRFTSVSVSGQALILNSFATTKNPLDSTRLPVYIPNLPNACGSDQIAQNQVMTFNIVYFVQANALWRRTVMPSNYTTKACSGFAPWQLPSCQPMTTPPAFCRVQDTKLVSNLQWTNFNIEYYDSAQATTANAEAQSATLATRQAALVNTNTVRVTINSTTYVAGRELSQQGVIKATRIGAFNDAVTPNP
jgi:Tfp pilus assembly protein PilE